ncbi:MAG: response regulator transcription factor [Clostridiales bacterium]
MNIIVIDDEFNIRKIISDYLTNEGYQVIQGEDGYDGLDKIIKYNNFDLILLDIRMPKMDGYETIKEIKKVTDTPVIFLTALDEPYDEVKGLNIGADDYITKPFSYKVLIARVKSCLRRSKENKVKKVSYGKLLINSTNKEIYIDNELIELTQKEFQLIDFLINNINITLKRELILDRIWGFDYYGDPRTVDTHIKTLRSKLGEYASIIKTIRGVGYKFEMEKNKIN